MPSWALVISTGDVRPVPMNVVSLIVDGDGAASATVPSVSGRSPADAEARAGSEPDERDGGERRAEDGGADQRAGREGGGGHGHEAVIPAASVDGARIMPGARGILP